MQRSPSATRTWAALSVPAPTVEGGWIGQVSEKASRGKKGPCAAHLPDKRFNQPALRTPHHLLALWDKPKSATTITRCKYPLALVWRAESERQGLDWAGSYFNYYTFKTHAAFWGVGEINFSGAPHLRDEEAVIQRAAAATHSHNLQAVLYKI